MYTSKRGEATAILIGLVIFLAFATFVFLDAGGITGAAIGGGELGDDHIWDINTLNLANSTSCGDVTSSLTLTANVNSSGTCFTIDASNIVLNCSGFNINYVYCDFSREYVRAQNQTSVS